MTDQKLQELAREEQRRYEKEWRAKNPDKVREKNRRYWAKRALKRLEASKEKEGERCDE